MLDFQKNPFLKSVNNNNNSNNNNPVLGRRTIEEIKTEMNLLSDNNYFINKPEPLETKEKGLQKPQDIIKQQDMIRNDTFNQQSNVNNKPIGFLGQNNYKDLMK